MGFIIEGGLLSDFTVLRRKICPASCLIFTPTALKQDRDKIYKNQINRQWKMYQFEFSLLVFDQLLL